MNKIGSKIILVLIFIAVFMFLGIYYIVNTMKVKNSSLSDVTTMETTQVKPTENTVLSDIKTELVDYRVYKLDGISFNFVIAKIRVSANSSTNIDLSHFTTDENIKLSEVDEYVSKLEAKSYYLGKQNVVFNLISYDTQYFANIFIPIINKSASQVVLKNDMDNSEMVFNLNAKIGDIKQLSYQADDVITDGKTYQMVVSSAFSITGEYLTQTESGVVSEYFLPSTVEVYAFKLEAVSLWGDEIIIENAQYETSDGNLFDALDSTINSEKLDNIIGRTITEKDIGYLFFVAYSPIENPVTYKGVLKLKVKGSDTWITVNVDLN